MKGKPESHVVSQSISHIHDIWYLTKQGIYLSVCLNISYACKHLSIHLSVSYHADSSVYCLYLCIYLSTHTHMCLYKCVHVYNIL